MSQATDRKVDQDEVDVGSFNNRVYAVDIHTVVRKVSISDRIETTVLRVSNYTAD